MNSLERVLMTIRHEEPDRVPIGEWGIDHDHVSRIIGHHTYWRNRKDTTLALWDGRRDEVLESLKKDCVELIDALDYDIVTVGTVPPRNSKPKDVPQQVSEGVWQDKSGNVYKYAASNDSISRITHTPGIEELTQADIDAAWERAENIDDSIFELIDFVGERYGGKKAIVFRDLDIYCGLVDPFGGDYNHQLIISKLAPEEIQKLYEPHFEYTKKVLEHCAAHNVTIAMQGQDFGMNTGCIISPDTLRDVFFPFIERTNQEIVKNGMIPFFHCCGKIWDIMDDFIKAGYKGYQSVQESAGMDTAKLKQKYGKKLTLWTGIQCETLVEGSLESTENEVNRMLDILMPGGGFIFGSTNSVQFGAKTENYLKALEIVKTRGIYR